MFHYMMWDSSDNKAESDECFKQLKHMWETQLLVAYFKTLNQNLDPKGALDVRLLKDIVERLCRQTDKLHRSQLISDDYLNSFNNTMMGIQLTLDSLEQNETIKFKTALSSDVINTGIPDEVLELNIPQKYISNDKRAVSLESG